MSVPPSGVSVVRNYRQLFKRWTGRDTILSDEIIWNIFNTVFDDSSSGAADKARLEEMKAQEIARVKALR